MNQNLEGNLHNETKRGENIRAVKSRWHQGFRVVCFFLGLVLLLHGASIVVYAMECKNGKNCVGRNSKVFGIRNEKENSIDVLVVGDSETYTSISPMQLYDETGITSYISGQYGQKIGETKEAIRIALETQKPKLILLETNVLYRSKGSADGILSSSLEGLQSRFPIFQYHNAWKNVLTGKKSLENLKGFEIRKWCKAYTGGEYMEETSLHREIPKSIQKQMDEIISLCKENNVTLVLYSAPSPKNYDGEKHNGIERYANEKNLAYVDLNLKTSELEIDWAKDTADHGDHLNLSGAQKTTRFLGTYLKDQFDLEDHRGDENLKEWDISLEEYHKKIT